MVFVKTVINRLKGVVSTEVESSSSVALVVRNKMMVVGDMFNSGTMRVSGTLFVNGTDIGSGVDLSAVSQSIVPSVDAAFDLGTSGSQWNTVYANSGSFSGSLLVNGMPVLTVASGGSGWIYINNIVVPGGSVTSKSYQDPAELILQSATISALTVDVHLSASYPLVEVDGNSATLSRGSSGVSFEGVVPVTMSAGGAIIATVKTADGDDGAVDTTTLNLDSPPVVSSGTFFGGYPGTQTELKSGDTFLMAITASKPFDEVVIASSGALTSATIVVPSGLTAEVTGTIANQGTSAQLLAGHFQVRGTTNNALSDLFSTDTLGSVDGTHVLNLNNLGPSFSVSSVDYPSGQGAVKNTEGADVNCTANNFDSILYSDPTGTDIVITNTTTFETVKAVSCSNPGDYNVSSTNFRAALTRNANGKTLTSNNVVRIADIAPSITVSSASARLISGGNQGSSPQDHVITITSNQLLNAAPTLNEDSGGSRGAFQGSWSGSGATWTRSLRVDESIPDEKGTFTFEGLVATGLAGLVQNTVGTGISYSLGGGVARDIPIGALETTFPIGFEIIDYSKVQAGGWNASAITSSLDPIEGDTTPNPGSGEYTIINKASPYSTGSINDTQIVVNNSDGSEILLDFEELP